MAKTNLRYTTARQKLLIKEALTCSTGKELLKKGWRRLDSGISMTGYKKGDIVVKIYYKGEAKYRDSYSHFDFYNKVPRRLKKYFARVYAVDRDRVIQAYAENTPSVWTEQRVRKAWEIEDTILFAKFNIDDVSVPGPQRRAHNMGIINNTPVFYDFGEESF